jgi:mannosyltransferase
MSLRGALMQARIPALVFFVALIPRLIDLASRPFWLDEVFTLQRATLPTAALVHDSFANHHMPSYFLLLSPFIALGHPQFWLRLPSAAFGALAVMLVYLIAARIGGRLAGLVAALILGLSPTALAFSQEARSYTMEMCLILIALCGVTSLASDVPRAALPLIRRDSMRVSWALFLIGSIAALDVLADGLPWVITANLIFAVMLCLTTRRRGLLLNFLAADGMIALFCAPFYVLMSLRQSSKFTDSLMWIPSLNIERFWYNIGSVYFMRVADSVSFSFMEVSTPVALSWAIDAALMIAVGLAVWRLARRPALLAALGVSLVFLPLLFTIISIWHPILLPRYILWSAAPFAVLAGIGVSYVMALLPRRALAPAFAAIAVVLLVNMLPYYGAETKPRWDIAANLLAQDVAPGDVVLLNDLGALPVLRVYLPAGVQTVVLADSNGDIKHARAAQLQGKRIWAVFGFAGQTAAKTAWPEFYRKTAALGTPEQIQVAGDRIYISLYEPAGRHLADNCGVPPAVVAKPAATTTPQVCS